MYRQPDLLTPHTDGQTHYQLRQLSRCPTQYSLYYQSISLVNNSFLLQTDFIKITLDFMILCNQIKQLLSDVSSHAC